MPRLSLPYISNVTRMEEIFRRYKPQYIFHAAAYKHVPMMEDNVSESIQVNVYGTRTVADLAVKYGAEKFVMISTDKAVNPTNVMGCSKRICEIYVQSLAKKLLAEADMSLSSSLHVLVMCWVRMVRDSSFPRSDTAWRPCDCDAS